MIYLQDPDFTLHHGDVLECLAEMPDESVDCVITSPPYWGLRDYGTGAWEGGDEGCDHVREAARTDASLQYSTLGPKREGLGENNAAHKAQQKSYGALCGKCGATRIDRQIGLEASPEQYVERMTAVFREVRRVLAAHGTCWVNMGDSYGSGTMGRNDQDIGIRNRGRPGLQNFPKGQQRTTATGLKPKDLCGIPWRLAFALQADGWYLRSDVVWSKPNPMPESVTDRPTKAHEYVFLLTKQPRYFFDQEAVREAHKEPWRGNGEREEWTTPTAIREGLGRASDTLSGWGKREYHPAGRNIRSVWEIATQPYPEAHFATFPEELVRRSLLAGCPAEVCGECGKPRERVVDKETVATQRVHNGVYDASSGFGKSGWLPGVQTTETIGFTDCGHNAYRPGIVLDPFMGSGTTALVARKHGRRAVGIELNEDYCKLAAKRLAQQSLLAL